MSSNVLENIDIQASENGRETIEMSVRSFIYFLAKVIYLFQS
jgi:hypothetical protein